ncbi:MAG: hypothetical protein H3C37_08425 [Candidatus Kapabacteria bacterium]|nr:hypothetical protein [Candidatus Kapabacteria bacterium]
MTRTLTTIVGSLFVLLLAAAPALAQTGTLQGKALYLYDGGSAANLNRIGLFTPADADLTTTYNLLLPKTQGAQNDILYVESTLGPVTTLQFTNGNGLFWRLLGNTSTTPWNGTSGNFLGTADAQNLVIRAGGANTIEFWNGTASANRWTIPAAGGLTQGADNSQVTFTGNVDATNGLDVTGANLTVGGANFTVAPGTGNTHTSGELDVDGNTTIGDAATDSHTILGVTTINGGTSTAATTIGNAAGGHVTLAVNPGTTNLVFNGIVQAVPTGTDDLLWIQSAGNEVRRTNIGGLVDEGLQYDNGKIRLGANAVDVNPIVSSRTATIGTGGTLTFSTTGGSNTMLVLNNNGNVGISTVGTGTTTIGNGSAGAISVTGGSTIGLTAGSTATVTAGSGNIDLNATTLDVNITAGTNVDVASATTNINTGTGNVNIGNAGGTNTITGTTNINTVNTGLVTTIGYNVAGNALTINSPTITAPNIPAGAATDNLVTVDGSGNLRTTSVATMLGSSAWVNGGNSFGTTGTLGTNDTYELNIETGGTTRWTVPAAGGLTQTDAGAISLAGTVTSTGSTNLGDNAADVHTILGVTNINTSLAAATDIGTGTATGNVTIGNTANTTRLGSKVVVAGTAQTVLNATLAAFDASYVKVTSTTATLGDYITMPAGTTGQIVYVEVINNGTQTLNIRNEDNVAVLGSANSGQTVLVTAIHNGTKWLLVSITGQP